MSNRLQQIDFQEFSSVFGGILHSRSFQEITGVSRSSGRYTINGYITAGMLIKNFDHNLG